jgi:hypothetical protein
MKCFAAATLSGLRITEGGRGTRIGRGKYLTAEPGSLSFASIAAFSELAGVVGRNAFLKADAVVHALVDVPFDERLTEADQFIARFLGWVNDFLMALWLVRDNSVMCTEGYLLLVDPPHGGSGMVRHHLGIYYWHSQLDRERVSFTTEELRNARDLMSEYIPRVGIPAEAG